MFAHVPVHGTGLLTGADKDCSKVCFAHSKNMMKNKVVVQLDEFRVRTFVRRARRRYCSANGKNLCAPLLVITELWYFV